MFGRISLWWGLIYFGVVLLDLYEYAPFIQFSLFCCALNSFILQRSLFFCCYSQPRNSSLALSVYPHHCMDLYTLYLTLLYTFMDMVRWVYIKSLLVSTLISTLNMDIRGMKMTLLAYFMFLCMAGVVNCPLRTIFEAIYCHLYHNDNVFPLIKLTISFFSVLGPHIVHVVEWFQHSCTHPLHILTSS